MICLYLVVPEFFINPPLIENICVFASDVFHLVDSSAICRKSCLGGRLRWWIPRRKDAHRSQIQTIITHYSIANWVVQKTSELNMRQRNHSFNSSVAHMALTAPSIQEVRLSGRVTLCWGMVRRSAFMFSSDDLLVSGCS